MSNFHKFAIAAVICVFCAFQISSAHADKYNINGLYWTLAIVFGLVTGFYVYKGMIKKGEE